MSKGRCTRRIGVLRQCLPDAVRSNSGLLNSEADSRNCARQGQHEHGELEPHRRQAPVSCMGLGPSFAEGRRAGYTQEA
jgi:hypothetical protein